MLKSNLNVPGTWHLRVQVMLTIANYVFNKLSSDLTLALPASFHTGKYGLVSCISVLHIFVPF